MKYGKEFQQILEGSHFPEDWKSSAVEYRQLKKLIKDVVNELSSMGLSHDVLHKLLVTEEEDVQAKQATNDTSVSIGNIEEGQTEKKVEDDEAILEFEFESDESPPTLSKSTFSPDLHRMHLPKEVILDPILVDDDQEGTIRDNAAGPSSLPADTSSTPLHHQHRKFRLRLLSDVTPEKPKYQPMGVSDMFKLRNEPLRIVKREERKSRKVKKRAVADGHGGVKAEYVLSGDKTHPIPQLRLHLSTSNIHNEIEPMDTPSTATSDAENTTTDESEDDLVDINANLDTSPLRTPKATLPSRIDVVPPSPTLQRLRNAVSPIWALASGTDIQDGMASLSLEPSQPTPSSSLSISGSNPTSTLIRRDSSPTSERDFIIPLASDLAFFNLLTAALTSLSTFHSAQQAAFHTSVAHLCTLISQSIQPSTSSSSSQPIRPSPNSSTHNKSSRKDLYAWREIFTLWIEAEIFESSAERSRGERTVDQAEIRLKKFAAEVVKRGLGDRRTMKGKKVRKSWEEFLRLNVLLLDLKRFQMANINAARKILKKHDKRTALTASVGFPDFVRSTLSSHVDKDGNASTWSFASTSLPHILLASLTDTLLPILPSLDDYACLICTSIAFKPIRLGCGHLFCVRCLVKMQRAGKGECPLCRSNVVLQADKNSLDLAIMDFMKEWFPKEVKEKQKENQLEVAKEQTKDAGMDTRCCIM